jgi:hypothetical protein
MAALYGSLRVRQTMFSEQSDSAVIQQTINDALTDEALGILFCEARTHDDWLDKPVGGDLLRSWRNKLSTSGRLSSTTSYCQCISDKVVFFVSLVGQKAV